MKTSPFLPISFLTLTPPQILPHLQIRPLSLTGAAFSIAGVSSAALALEGALGVGAVGVAVTPSAFEVRVSALVDV